MSFTTARGRCSGQSEDSCSGLRVPPPGPSCCSTQPSCRAGVVGPARRRRPISVVVSPPPGGCAGHSFLPLSVTCSREGEPTRPRRRAPCQGQSVDPRLLRDLRVLLPEETCDTFCRRAAPPPLRVCKIDDCSSCFVPSPESPHGPGQGRAALAGLTRHQEPVGFPRSRGREGPRSCREGIFGGKIRKSLLRGRPGLAGGITPFL